MRITDDILLFDWNPPPFAMQFLNKVRTGRRWKKSIAQCGEEELMSFVERIIQGMFACHHDRTRTISYFTVRGKSWTKQILSDAWESTNWEDLIDHPLHTVIAESKLTEKERTFYCQECWSGNLWKLSTETLHRVCGYRSPLTYWKLSGIRVAYFAGKSDKTT